MSAYLYYPAEEFGFDIAKDHPAIGAWLERMKALPGWKHPYELMPGHPFGTQSSNGKSASSSAPAARDRAAPSPRLDRRVMPPATCSAACRGGRRGILALIFAIRQPAERQSRRDKRACRR